MPAKDNAADTQDKSKDQDKGKDTEQAKGQGRTTTPSVGQGPTQNQGDESGGASNPQARRSALATTEREMDERAEVVASSHVQSVAPARAREEAKAARRRAEAVDPEQAKVEQKLAELLDEVADRYEAEQAVSAERSRIQHASGVPQQVGGTPSGQLGEPLPGDVKRGAAVVYHTPGTLLDATGLVINLWPAVAEDPDNPSSKEQRWRADLVSFPLRGSPGTHEGVAYGSGAGQFQLASELEEDERGLPEGWSQAEAPYRHEIH